MSLQLRTGHELRVSKPYPQRDGASDGSLSVVVKRLRR